MSSITPVANTLQDVTPESATSAFPIVEETIEREQSEKPNKYHYPEFSGISGEKYLLALAEKFAPFALWRTWQAFVSFQAPGNTCYVGVDRVIDPQEGRVGIKDRKIYLDLAALEERGWVRLQRVKMAFPQENGTVLYHLATEKDFTGFYDTAHDYHVWLQDKEHYIAPVRENIPLILADEKLCKRLIKFENYRRLLLSGKPGRKPTNRPDFHTSQLRQLEVMANLRKSDPKVNLYSNPDSNAVTNEDSAYGIRSNGGNRIPQESINEKDIDSKDSTSGSEESSAVADQAIRNPETKQPTEQGTVVKCMETKHAQSKSTSNPPFPQNRNGAAAAKDVIESLGYTEGELKHDRKKRGAALAGIPAAQYEVLSSGQGQAAEEEPQDERQPERPAREIPAKVTEDMTTYAKLYDEPHLVTSAVTRARKIYATAEQALDSFSAALYWSFFDEARKKAAKYARRKNSKGRVNRVPYMATCLESAFRFSLEELVYLRSEYPLYTDYSLWDVIDILREAHHKEYHNRETRLDYREWLQEVLDDLEKCKEPKQRTNPTQREY